MQTHLFVILFLLWSAGCSWAQEAFVINNYDVNMHITRDAVIKVTETIDLTFTEERHGIFRKIPFRYYAAGGGEALRPFRSQGDEIRIFLTNVEVVDWEYELSKEGDYEVIKIGSADQYVHGAQRYVIRYEVYNAINFFETHSEFYWNAIGQEWDTPIEKTSFQLTWEGVLPADYQPVFFAATGSYGSAAQNADIQFTDRRSFSGKTNMVLQAHEGVSVGFSFPKDFFQQTPIPPSVMAEKFYFKNQELNIKVLKNGVAEVTERYTVVPVRRMNSITRHLYPFLNHQSPSLKDWLGGQSRYIVAKIRVSGTPTCRSRQNKSLCFDISDLPVGAERTIEVKYLTYGNFSKLPDVQQNLQTYAFVSINQGISEPVLKSTIQIELPEGNAQNTVFKSEIHRDGNFVRQARVRQMNDNTFLAEIGAEGAFLEPNEKLIFRLSVPDHYFTGGVMRYKWQLFWLNNRYLFLPVLFFLGFYYAWNRWGRDETFSKMVHYYPPDDLPPSEAGILIDDKLHDRDLLALIPYWGAKGYIEIEETGTDSIWEKDDYIFKKRNNIPASAPAYEKKMFDGIFGKNSDLGKEVKLSSLKNKFYSTMDEARKLLEKEIKRKSFYVPHTRGAGVLMLVLGIILAAFGGIFFVITRFDGEDFTSPEFGFGLFGAGVLSIIFGRIMPKKAPIGLASYKKLAGFELFVKDAELPRLESFLKEDPHYFDKTLPYAIVFNHVEKWAKKFEALSAPPPSWYHNPRQDTFSAWVFTTHLSSAMRDMGSTFASRPSSSGSGGSSFGGGGGFSGGGFGGGGGGSW